MRGEDVGLGPAAVTATANRASDDDVVVQRQSKAKHSLTPRPPSPQLPSHRAASAVFIVH